jgi:ABC-2 type transport system permease protein
MEILGSFVKGNDWLKDSSLFSHVALAPAATPDWGQAAIILALGIAAAALGAAAFQRRDLVSA